MGVACLNGSCGACPAVDVRAGDPSFARGEDCCCFVTAEGAAARVSIARCDGCTTDDDCNPGEACIKGRELRGCSGGNICSPTRG